MDPTDTETSRAVDSSGRDAVDELFTRVYAELKGLAHRVRGDGSNETFNTTALVHEAFIKLSASKTVGWRDEAHFFAVAARAMRQVLVDAARRRLTEKRGGGEPLLMSYDDARHAAPVRPAELIALDEALERLASFDRRRAQVVEHRIFGGLSTRDIARVLGVSAVTVERDWRTARAWLSAELARDWGTGAAE